MNWLHPLFKIRTPQEIMGRSVAPPPGRWGEVSSLHGHLPLSPSPAFQYILPHPCCCPGISHFLCRLGALSCTILCSAVNITLNLYFLHRHYASLWSAPWPWVCLRLRRGRLGSQTHSWAAAAASCLPESAERAQGSERGPTSPVPSRASPARPALFPGSFCVAGFVLTFLSSACCALR